MSTQRILVVDDEVHIRRLLQGTLKRAGYDVVEAVNATEALEEARRAKPDAILLDLGLPDRDGLEIIQLLKAALAAPIIVVSAREATEQKRLSKAALETLAIVAYHQPVTRAEIENIRGHSSITNRASHCANR